MPGHPRLLRNVDGTATRARPSLQQAPQVGWTRRAGADAERDQRMANITAQMVKELREQTGAGMMDCKTALGETAGEMEAAVDLLRKKGLAKAAKKAGRIAAD